MHTPRTLSRLVSLIGASPARCGPVRVVAIDGGAAAGKSSLAGLLADRLPQAAVLHLDDLLDGWSGQFSYADRLRTGVLEPLAAGHAGSYRRYDWTAGRFGELITVQVGQTLLVEGVSAITGCAGWYSVALFLDVARAERERRWVERDGPLQPAWQRWLDAEDRYFAANPLPGEVCTLTAPGCDERLPPAGR